MDIRESESGNYSHVSALRVIQFEAAGKLTYKLSCRLHGSIQLEIRSDRLAPSDRHP